jgi:hypothetical protein
MSFYIVAFDDEKKQWYEAGLVKGSKSMEACLDTTGGALQISIENKPTRISNTLDILVYKFEFQIVPAKAKASTVEFALGPTQRLVKQWKDG